MIIKNFLIIFAFSILSFNGLFAQNKPYKVVEYKAPVYPPAARALSVLGDVAVNVVIDKDGKVISSIAKTGHPVLKQACEKAANEWRFKADKNREQREAKITFSFSWAKGDKAGIKFKKPYRLKVTPAISRLETLETPDY